MSGLNRWGALVGPYWTLCPSMPVANAAGLGLKVWANLRSSLVAFLGLSLWIQSLGQASPKHHPATLPPAPAVFSGRLARSF